MIGGPDDVHQPALLPWHRFQATTEVKVSAGNGVNIAAVYDLLRQVADRVVEHDRQFERLGAALGALRSELYADLQEIRSEMAGMRTEIRDLCSDVRTYTGSVFAQGVRIEEVDERLRRVERHLNLAPGK